MAEKKYKHDKDYLYRQYIKAYKKGDRDKVIYYNNLANQLHGTDFDVIYHNKLERKEKAKGPHGIGRIKKIKYG